MYYFFSFLAHCAFGLTYISNTPRVLQGRKKNSILQQELWDLIYLHESKLFSFQFSFTSLFLLLNFGMQSWYSSTTIWNCKNIRAWKINPTIIWKKYSSINKNKSGVKNLKTYWLYLWSENNYDKEKIEKLSSIIIYFRKLIVLYVMYYIQV